MLLVKEQYARTCVAIWQRNINATHSSVAVRKTMDKETTIDVLLGQMSDIIEDAKTMDAP